MESSQSPKSLPQQKPFAPFVAKTLSGKDNSAVFSRLVHYNEKHNVIISCAFTEEIHVHDALTLKHLDTEILPDAGCGMSFSPETESYIFGTLRGNMRTYEIGTRGFSSGMGTLHYNVFAITFIDSELRYAFTELGNPRLGIGGLPQGRFLDFGLGYKRPSVLYSLIKKKLLLAGDQNGSLFVFRTNLLPRFPVIQAIWGHDKKNYETSRNIQSIIMSKREYILTVGSDCTIRIWHFSKGKMRRIKVIQTGEQVLRVIYLEDYKMLVTTNQTQFVKFWRFPSGKLECVLDLEMDKAHTVFLMKDRSYLGVLPISKMMKVVKLHP